MEPDTKDSNSFQSNSFIQNRYSRVLQRNRRLFESVSSRLSSQKPFKFLTIHNRKLSHDCKKQKKINSINRLHKPNKSMNADFEKSNLIGVCFNTIALISKTREKTLPRSNLSAIVPCLQETKPFKISISIQSNPKNSKLASW